MTSYAWQTNAWARTRRQRRTSHRQHGADEISGDAAKQPEKIDGFTPEQRFFIGWGQIWCQNQTDQTARLLALNNEHSPGKYRANGVVQNMPEFQKAWGCKTGQPMVRANACHVW